MGIGIDNIARGIGQKNQQDINTLSSAQASITNQIANMLGAGVVGRIANTVTAVGSEASIEIGITGYDSTKYALDVFCEGVLLYITSEYTIDSANGEIDLVGWTATAGDKFTFIAYNIINIQTINAQTGTTYTVAASDIGKLVTLSNALDITVTLPQDSDVAIPIGARIDFLVINTGMATFAAGTGATANATPSLVSRAQWSAMTAIKRAANTWVVVGDLA